MKGVDRLQLCGVWSERLFPDYLGYPEHKDTSDDRDQRFSEVFLRARHIVAFLQARYNGHAGSIRVRTLSAKSIIKVNILTVLSNLLSYRKSLTSIPVVAYSTDCCHQVRCGFSVRRKSDKISHGRMRAADLRP
jgi:hypothetical protein